MNFQQKLADYVLGNRSNSDLIDIAETGLEESLNSSSLAILAGISENENSLVIQEYFQKTLKELGIVLPSERESMFVLIDFYLTKILKNEISVFKGLDRIKSEVLFKVEIHSDKYAYDGIGFEKIYGIYVELDELIHDEIQLDKSKTKEEWIKLIESEAIDAIINWKEKYKI